ncbi:hypothetical protein GEMRC1_005422 [Eukaryota sp. GEM-RC1]
MYSKNLRSKLLAFHPSKVFDSHVDIAIKCTCTVNNQLTSSSTSLSPPFLHGLFEWSEAALRALHLYQSSKVLRTPISSGRDNSFEVDVMDFDEGRIDRKEDEVQFLKKENEMLNQKVDELMSVVTDLSGIYSE